MSPGTALLLLAVAPLLGCGSHSREQMDLSAAVDLAMAADLSFVPTGTPCRTIAACDHRYADSCSDGKCLCGSGSGCVSGQLCCAGHCVDPNGDPDNCGGCGMRCASRSCRLDQVGAVAFPTCDCMPPPDGGLGAGDDGGSDCVAETAPDCTPSGHCTCGGTDNGYCSTRVGTQCVHSPSGAGCACGTSDACNEHYADHCDPALDPPCRCADEAACDPVRSGECIPGVYTDVNGTTETSCRCGNGPQCAAGAQCCKLQAGTASCCRAGQYCCVDGCCDRPCVLFGFCGT